jgi:hypothetical protein
MGGGGNREPYASCGSIQMRLAMRPVNAVPAIGIEAPGILEGAEACPPDVPARRVWRACGAPAAAGPPATGPGQGVRRPLRPARPLPEKHARTSAPHLEGPGPDSGAQPGQQGLGRGPETGQGGLDHARGQAAPAGMDGRRPGCHRGRRAGSAGSRPSGRRRPGPDPVPPWRPPRNPPRAHGLAPRAQPWDLAQPVGARRADPAPGAAAPGSRRRRWHRRPRDRPD